MKTSLAVICYLCDALTEIVDRLVSTNPSLGGGRVRAAAQSLKSDVGQLLKAWSDMAIRNVLADMLRTVRHIETDLGTGAVTKAATGTSGGWVSGKIPTTMGWIPGNVPKGPRSDATIGVNRDLSTCKALCIDLLKRIDAELMEHSPSQARYSEVVCVGYKVKVAFDEYRGQTDDAADMLMRCNALKDAIRAAYALADRDGRQYNSRSNILKVFVAPEFYFRGKNGAYDHALVHGEEQQTDVTGTIVKVRHKGIAELMLEEIAKPEYKDWLFVLGTAIAATKVGKTVCLQCNGPVTFDVNKTTGKSTPRCTVNASHKTGEQVTGAQVENVGLIIKEGEVHTVTKELVSHIDYVENKAMGQKDHVTLTGSGTAERLPVARFPKPSGYNAATGVPTKFSDERMGGCIFTIDGITVGVEVCLDHAASVGSTSAGRLNHAGNIQLQLIPSAGMTIGSLRTIPGGVVFNVDGLTPHVQVIAGATPTLQFSQDTRDYTFSGATWAEMAPIGANLNGIKMLADAGRGAWRVGAPTAVGPAGSGAVVLYGPFNLPRA